MTLDLKTQIQYLKGVGPKLGEIFERKGIYNIGDLISYYPRSFEDRRAARNIASLKDGEVVSMRAQIVKIAQIQLGKSYRKMTDVEIKDESGKMHCKFFRIPYRGYFDRFTPGQFVRVVGKVTHYGRKLEFHHPDLREDTEEELKDVLVPIYPETEGLTTTKIGRLIQLALKEMDVNSPYHPLEKLPEWIRKKYNLISKFEALKSIHNPSVERAEEYLNFRSPAHSRLIFEEFFWLELYLALKKSGFKKEKAYPIKADGIWVEQLLKSLPFPLTKAQRRSFQEIKEDLIKDSPMHRLVQGDVGCGKTMVVFMSATWVAESGAQSCLMVPTEILAEQHYKNAVKFLEPLGVRVALLTGKMKTSERNVILEQLKQGQIHFLIGTHALIESDIQFKQLSLVAIDEQHRFGVEQRNKLKLKGMSPHFLILTATPIPRTLSMTVYGDLDVSIIDEMPPGRVPIQTRVAFESKRPQMIEFLMKQIKEGRQGYIIYPLVEESEKIDLKDAITQFEHLKNTNPEIRFGLLHGKMKSDEKEFIMEEFRNGKIQVLVSTTVIEVGVDVPNANIIIIEHAERFGLSQLHQLRGRVGRGIYKSYCILALGHAVSQEAITRTKFMESTTDGFKIAEFDLELRGPGEILGTRQSGLSGFALANLARDQALLQEARAAAFEVAAKDPKLAFTEHASLREELLRSHGPTALASVG